MNIAQDKEITVNLIITRTSTPAMLIIFIGTRTIIPYRVIIVQSAINFGQDMRIKCVSDG